MRCGSVTFRNEAKELHDGQKAPPETKRPCRIQQDNPLSHPDKSPEPHAGPKASEPCLPWRAVRQKEPFSQSVWNPPLLAGIDRGIGKSLFNKHHRNLLPNRVQKLAGRTDQAFGFRNHCQISLALRTYKNGQQERIKGHKNSFWLSRHSGKQENVQPLQKTTIQRVRQERTKDGNPKR